MKNRFLGFLKKYWICILLNLILLLGMFLSKCFGNLYVIKNDLLSYNLHTLYVIKAIPIYSFVYGCLSYFVCKKIWIPQLIFAISTILSFVLIASISKVVKDLIIGVLIITPFYLICSTIGTLITIVIYRMIHHKTNK